MDMLFAALRGTQWQSRNTSQDTAIVAPGNDLDGLKQSLMLEQFV
jgi:hypothetical protein